MFITTKNNVITGIHTGSKVFAPTSQYYGSECVDISDTSNCRVGDSTDFYDTDKWQRKTDAKLVKEKLLTIPSGYKLDGESIREMTADEKIVAGLESVPSGYKISDGKVVEMTQDEKYIAGVVALPSGYKISGGKVVAMTTSEKVAAGIITIPSGYKLNGENIVEMTQIEKINAGLETVPAGYKLVENELVSMTYAEKLEAGLITQDEYNAAVKSQVDYEINKRLSAINTAENQAKALIDDAFATEFKTALSAVLSVKSQSGYPLSVDWTGIPESL